jgi:cellulose synthase/poly-beta-1,6-N-acetylglucosamine synthase-like glycosyltransferase
MFPADIAVVLIGGILAYAWGLYPLLLRRAASSPASTGPKATNEQQIVDVPHITVIISAYNEEAVIGERVRNLLALDYPADCLRILLGVDGGTDRTAEVARAAAGGDPRVEVLAFEKNRGKVAVLKSLVARVQGSGFRAQAEAGVREPRTSSLKFPTDALVFSDANTMFQADALRQLVSPLSNPSIGGVCGRLVFVAGAQGSTIQPPPTDAQPEGTYWSWETKLKTWESRLDSCLGANGAIYAIRASLFPYDIPDNTIVDDFVIGMKVREAGLRLVYEPLAVAREELPERRDEWRRRVRIGAGDFQALAVCSHCLRPRYGWFAWCFWSHKVLRWVTPHLIIALVMCSLWGVALGSGFCFPSPSVLALTGLAALLTLGLIGRIIGSSFCLGQVAWHFVEMQAALFVGFLRFCRGNLQGRWHRTPRVRVDAPRR